MGAAVGAAVGAVFGGGGRRVGAAVGAAVGVRSGGGFVGTLSGGAFGGGALAAASMRALVAVIGAGHEQKLLLGTADQSSYERRHRRLESLPSGLSYRTSSRWKPWRMLRVAINLAHVACRHQPAAQ